MTAIHPNFVEINRAALAVAPALLDRLLPSGRRRGDEWVALNPHRRDRTAGSFKINLRTGRWADFATGDKGGDVISLAAFLWGVPQIESSRRRAPERDRR